MENVNRKRAGSKRKPENMIRRIYPVSLYFSNDEVAAFGGREKVMEVINRHKAQIISEVTNGDR